MESAFFIGNILMLVLAALYNGVGGEAVFDALMLTVLLGTIIGAIGWMVKKTIDMERQTLERNLKVGQVCGGRARSCMHTDARAWDSVTLDLCA